MAIEEWQSIAGFEGVYEVSSLGNVRSLDRTVSHGCKGLRFHHGCKLTPNQHRDGYLKVTLRRNGASKTQMVHRIVCETFHGAAPAGKQVGHRDGNRLNNRSENLRWVTPAENADDRNLHGTTSRGERQGRAKLNDRAVRDIRRLAGTHTQRQIATQFGVSQTAIWMVLNNREWRHVA